MASATFSVELRSEMRSYLATSVPLQFRSQRGCAAPLCAVGFRAFTILKMKKPKESWFIFLAGASLLNLSVLKNKALAKTTN